MSAAARAPKSAAAEKQRARLQRAGWAILFAVGCCAWIFKMKRSLTAEDYVLPYSPLQVLYPLLGVLGLGAVLRTAGARFPKIMVRSPATLLFIAGSLFIMVGASVHIAHPQFGKDAALFVVRWLLPYCFLLFLHLARKQGVPYRPVIWGCIVGAVASALFTELYRSGLRVPISTSGERYGGFLNHPNQYGILVSTTAPLLAVFIYSRNRLRTFIGLAMIGVYGLCLFQSLSKTNIVLVVISGLGAAALISLPNVGLAARRIFLALAIFALVALAGVSGLQVLAEISPKEAKTIENAIFDPGGTKSLEDRENIWDDAIDAIRAHPVLGVGPGRSEVYLLHGHAHNLFLQHWIDAGIAGFAGIWLVTFGVFWRAFELFMHAARARERLTEDGSIRVLGGFALVMSIFANSMSASLTTAVMTTFVIFIGLAFVREPEVLPA